MMWDVVAAEVPAGNRHPIPPNKRTQGDPLHTVTGALANLEEAERNHVIFEHLAKSADADEGCHCNGEHTFASHRLQPGVGVSPRYCFALLCDQKETNIFL